MAPRRGRGGRAAVVLVAVALAAVPACGTEDGGGDDAAGSGGGKGASAKGELPDGTDLKLREGETFTWPDGLAVTVVKADEFRTSGYGAGRLPFRLHFTFHNGGDEPLVLDDFATFVEGAARGGKAARTSFSDDTKGISGRLAPGATKKQTEDRVIKKEYGREIVITLQYGKGATAEDYPEVTATIG